MRKFFERSLKKVKEEQEQKRDRELYEKQVQNKQRLFRLEFEARQGIILEDDEKIEKEELTLKSLLDSIIDENKAKLKKKNDILQTYEEFELYAIDEKVFEEAESKLHQPDMNLIELSVNKGPSVLNDYRMAKSNAASVDLTLNIEHLVDRLHFLENSYLALNNQIIKEDKTQETLEKMADELANEKITLQTHIDISEKSMKLLDTRFSDMGRIMHAAKNKLLLTNSNLAMYKEHVKAMKNEGKEYTEHKMKEYGGLHKKSLSMESKVVNMLVQLDRLKEQLAKTEKRLVDLDDEGKAIARKIEDISTSLKCIQVMSTLHITYFKEGSLPPSPAFLGRRLAKSNSISPARKLGTIRLSDPLNGNPATPRKISLSLDPQRSSSSRSRMSMKQMTSPERMEMIEKIERFFEEYEGKVYELGEKLANQFMKMTMQDQTFKASYEELSLMKRSKVAQLQHLEEELNHYRKKHGFIEQLERQVDLEQKNEDMMQEYKGDFQKTDLSSTNQVVFNTQEILPMLSPRDLHKTSENFFFVSYIFIVETIRRVCAIITAIGNTTDKLAVDLLDYVSELQSFLSNVKNFAPVPKEKKKKAFRRDFRLPTYLELESQKSLDSVLTNRDFSDDSDKEDPVLERIKAFARGQELVPHSKAEIKNLIDQLMTGSEEEIEKLVEKIRQDNCILCMFDDELVKAFLNRLALELNAEPFVSVALENVTILKEEAMINLRSRFEGLVSKFSKLLEIVSAERNTLKEFVAKNPALLLRKVAGTTETAEISDKIAFIQKVNKDRVHKLQKVHNYDRFEMGERLRRANAKSPNNLDDQAKKMFGLTFGEVTSKIDMLLGDNRRKLHEKYSEISKKNKHTNRIEEEVEIPEWLPQTARAILESHHSPHGAAVKSRSPQGKFSIKVFGGRTHHRTRTKNILVTKTDESFEQENSYLEAERDRFKTEMYKTMHGGDDFLSSTRPDAKAERHMGFLPSEEPYNQKKKVNETAAVVRKILKLERTTGKLEGKPVDLGFFHDYVPKQHKQRPLKPISVPSLVLKPSIMKTEPISGSVSERFSTLQHLQTKSPKKIEFMETTRSTSLSSNQPSYRGTQRAPSISERPNPYAAQKGILKSLSSPKRQSELPSLTQTKFESLPNERKQTPSSKR